MRFFEFVRITTLPTGATLAALLVAHNLWPEFGGRFVHRNVGGKASVISSQVNDPVRDGTSFVRGGIAGVLPTSLSVREGLPHGQGWPRITTFDLEFADLLDTLHKGSRHARAGRSLWRAVGDFLSLSSPPTGKLREETVLDPNFGEISMHLAIQLGWSAKAPLHGRARGNVDDARETLREFETNLRAAMNASAVASASAAGSDLSQAPINVNNSTFDGSASVGSDFSTGVWATPGVNPIADANANAPQPQGWYGIAQASTLSGGSYDAGNGSSSGGSLVVTGPLSPMVNPVWRNFTPSPVPVSGSNSAFSGSWRGGSGNTTATASAPVPQIVSRIALASVPVSGSNLALNTSSVRGSAISSAAVPAIAPPPPAFINGGFETGDLTGWTGNGGTVGAVTSYGKFTPVEGSFLGYVEAGLGENVYTTLSQTVTMTAGSVISGYWGFQANDYPPFDDDGYLSINGTNLLTSDVNTVGAYGNTGWEAFSYVIPTDGAYTLQIGVENQGDNGFPSGVVLDGVIPEPASLTMLVAGLAGIGVMRRRTRRGA